MDMSSLFVHKVSRLLALSIRCPVMLVWTTKCQNTICTLCGRLVIFFGIINFKMMFVTFLKISQKIEVLGHLCAESCLSTLLSITCPETPSKHTLLLWHYFSVFLWLFIFISYFFGISLGFFYVTFILTDTHAVHPLSIYNLSTQSASKALKCIQMLFQVFSEI